MPHRPPFLPRLALLFALGIASSVFAAEPDAPPAKAPAVDMAALQAQLDALIVKLDDEAFRVREEASLVLYKLPGEALPLVEAALKREGLSQEARMRLSRVRPLLKAKVIRAHKAERKAAVLAFYRKSMLEAYDRIGMKDPRWDGFVRTGLEAAVDFWCNDKGTYDQAQLGYDTLQKAIDQGCKDPLVWYIRARMYDLTRGRNWKTAGSMHLEAVTLLKEDSGYDGVRQAFIYGRAAEAIGRINKEPGEEDKARIELFAAKCLRNIDKAAVDKDVPPEVFYDLCRTMVNPCFLLAFKDRKIGFDKVYAVMARHLGDSVMLPTLKGEVYVEYAWDGRGRGYANTVTEDGWRKMAERLEIAERELTKAWEKDPTDPKIPNEMLTIELGQHHGRERMELWYRRAMEADPDNKEAVSKKMYYLEPKWHGDYDEMVNFGRELVREGNWEAKLPFQLIHAHKTLAGYTEDRKAYFRENADVWKDVSSVFEGYLKHHPDDHHQRNNFCEWAVTCEKWEAAKKLFDELGDKADPRPFGGPEKMRAAKAKAAAEAGNNPKTGDEGDDQF